MQSFYVGYKAKDISLMMNRFSFSSWDQVELFHTYLEELIANFLQQNASYEVIPLASLMDKNLKATLGYLNETLAFNLCSRVLTSNLNASGNDCAYYFMQAGLNDTQAATACAGQNFSDPNSVNFFLNATWYGGQYADDMMAQT